MTFIDNPPEHVVVMDRREVSRDSAWLNTRQAGNHVSFSAATIRKVCGRHELQHIRVGHPRGPILTRTEWIDAWMMRGVQDPAVG